MGAVGVGGEVDDQARGGACTLAPPDPDKLVLFRDGVAPHAHAVGNVALPRYRSAGAAAVEGEAVIATLDACRDDLAQRQRRRAVAAAVEQRGRLAARVAEEHDRVVADAAGERFFLELVGAGGNVPGVSNKHDYPPEMFDERSIRLDVCGPDDRPPFLDGGAVQGAQRLRRLLIARRDLLAEIAAALGGAGIVHRLPDTGVRLPQHVPRRPLLPPPPLASP